MTCNKGLFVDIFLFYSVKIYLATARPENNQYFLLGPGAGEAYKSALNGKNGDFLDKINDCTIVESKTFEVPGVDQPVDPLSREVTVGEYVTMFDTVSSVMPSSEYRSAMRDIVIYDEAKDGFVKVDAANFSGWVQRSLVTLVGGAN